MPGSRVQARIFGPLNANVDAGATVQAAPYADDSSAASFDSGTTARRATIVWIGATVWLVLVWRAVEGY